MKRLRSDFNETNKNIKNDMIDTMSKDDYIKEILYGYTIGKSDSNKNKRS